MNLDVKELRLSVIVPVYNAEPYLHKCVDSILGQSYGSLEVILVDDGSTDESLEICKRYQENDCRVAVIHQENKGLVSSRRTGVRRATGEYITFVDADDYIDQSAYEHILSLLDSSQPDLVAYGLVEIYPDKKIEKHNCYEAGVYAQDELHKLYTNMLSYGAFFDFGLLPNLVCKWIKRSFLERTQIEVSNDVTVGEDADATYQMMVNAESVQLINYAPYRYCKRNDSMMWKQLDYTAIRHLEKDLRTAFERAAVAEIMERQLKDYIAFITLLKHPSKILHKELPFSNQNERIALYGAGGMGQAVYFGMDANITLWVDRDYEQYRQQGLDVRPPEELLSSQQYDVVFIAILNIEICEAIKHNLIGQGVRKEILYYRGEANDYDAS